MKRKLRIICLLLFVALGMIWVLEKMVGDSTARKNGFNRHFKTNAINATVIADFNNQVKGVAGVYGDEIYLFDKTPGRISKTTYELKGIDTVKFRIPEIPNLAPVFKTFVQFPNVYIIGGNSKTFTSGNLVTGASNTNIISPNFFSSALILSNLRIIIRIADMSKSQGYFEFGNQMGDSIIMQKKMLQASTLYSVAFDCEMLYDSIRQRIYLMHFFCNQLTCLDTNMNVLFTGHTIDTFHYPQVNIVRTFDGLTHGKPPLIINSTGCISDNRIFIHSNLKADNEKKTDFNKHDVIDVYLASDAHYLFSIYIPKYLSKSFGYFKVMPGNILLAFYTNKIIKYDLNL